MKTSVPKIVARGKPKKTAADARALKTKGGKPGFLSQPSLLALFRKRPKLTGKTYGNAADFSRLPHSLRGLLSAVTRRQLFSELAVGTGILALLIGLIVGGEMGVDWFLEMPQGARITVLVTGLGVVGLIGYYGVVRPFSHRLTAQTAALKVEQRWPELRSLIITGVQFILRGPTTAGPAEELEQSVIQSANLRANGLAPAQVVPLKLVYRGLLLRLLPLLVLIAAIFVCQPASGILLKRFFGLNVWFPTQTYIEAVTKDMETVTGADVPISAKALGVIPASGLVTIEIGGRTLEEHIPELPGGIFKFTVRNVQEPFKYSFRFNDAEGARYQVLVKPAPAIAAITFVAAPPAYTHLAPITFSGGGAEILAGSQLTIHGQTTLRLKSAKLVETIDSPSEAASANGTAVTKEVPVKIDPDGKTFSAEMQIPIGLEGISIPLVSDTDVHSVNDPVYRLQVSVDQPPTVAISDPAESTITLTPDGSITVTATMSDDFGLAKAFVCIQPMSNEEGAPSSVQTKAAPVTRFPIDLGIKPAADGKTNYPLGGTVNIPVFAAKQNPSWTVGMQVKVWVEASDNNTATGPSLGQSDFRTISIISKEDKEKEIQDKVAGLASEFGGLHRKQDVLRSSVGAVLKGNSGAPAPPPPPPGK